jgi:propanediol dehydratase small subunit
MENQEQQFIKGFNHGYVLAEHEPDLVKSIIANKNEHNIYFKGIVSGKQEYDMEKIRLRLHGMNRNDSPSHDISKDKGRTKD